MRPLVRLALAKGLKHAQLQALLQQQLLDEAARIWKNNGVLRPNVSQLAITTGLNRKLISERVRFAPREGLTSSEESAAARVFTYWQQMAGKQPALKILPVNGVTASFEVYARVATRGDMHHRAVLDELVRLGMAREFDGMVELTADAFVPSKDDRALLSFLASNGHDHVMAAVENVIARQPLFLEQSVFAEGLRATDCEAIQNSVREDWASLHVRLVPVLLQAIEVAPADAKHRMRVGVYTYFTPIEPTEDNLGIKPPNSDE